MREKHTMAKGSSSGSSASKSLMWMMAALFIGLGALLGAGLFVASRAIHSLGLSAAGAQDGVRTPGGTFRVQKQADVGPGMPLYPRASLLVPDDQAAAAAAKEAQGGIETSAYHTSDAHDSVESWYSQHLSPEFARHEAGDKSEPAIYSSMHISDKDVAFVAQREQMVRVVALSPDSGGTKISLIRYSKPAPAAPAASSAPATISDQPTPPSQ